MLRKSRHHFPTDLDLIAARKPKANSASGRVIGLRAVGVASPPARIASTSPSPGPKKCKPLVARGLHSMT
jgi:hypothetical protein